MGITAAGTEHHPENNGISDKLNRLRAGVLGANDGIVSTAGLVLGMAGSGADEKALLLAGVAGLFSGALSMAAGEYVSVSTQRDTERAAVAYEACELKEMPEEELEELTGILMRKGLSRETAEDAAAELSKHNALAAHAEMELGIRPDNYANPWEAALASALSFSLGALVPLCVILQAPRLWAGWYTAAAVVLSLCVTGYTSAKLGRAPVLPAGIRNVTGGLFAMAATYAVGRLAGWLLA